LNGKKDFSGIFLRCVKKKKREKILFLSDLQKSTMNEYEEQKIGEILVGEGFSPLGAKS